MRELQSMIGSAAAIASIGRGRRSAHTNIMAARPRTNRRRHLIDPGTSRGSILDTRGTPIAMAPHLGTKADASNVGQYAVATTKPSTAILRCLAQFTMLMSLSI